MTDGVSHDSVVYTFGCDDLDDTYYVLGFEAVELLDRPYRIALHLSAADDQTDSLALLGKSIWVTLERGTHRRSFFGIADRVAILDDGALRQECTVDVLPALSALRLTRNTRIFQDQSALTIAKTVLEEGLAPYGRELDTSSLASSDYQQRDFCVQYRETNLDFVQRLLEEEGIGYYFEQSDPERLVLFGDNRQLGSVVTMDGGPVRFDDAKRSVHGAEPIVRFRAAARITSTGVTVRDHDWTRARPLVEERSDPTLPTHVKHEVYEHGLAQNATITEDQELLATLVSLVVNAAVPDGLPFGLGGIVRELPGAVLGGFTSENAEFQARIRDELMRLNAKTARGASEVIGFSPGRRFDLVGHPTLGADGAYVIAKVEHSSATDGDEPKDYRNTFECVPATTAWRPDRKTRKPRIYGVQTATVTGPVGADVHTDQHGRVKVRFNWDRSDDDVSGSYTCWIRVSQSWAGDGFPGMLFIPRVGMEVVVSFVDGDPDRPLVTGCVYNGKNPTPNLLPLQATKSTIKTRTIPHGTGYNELSFEDAMGKEEIFIRAERDLSELVGQDHATLVHRDQANEVFGNQTVRVGADQHMTVLGNQASVVDGARTARVSGDADETVGGTRRSRSGGSETVVVERGSRLVQVQQGEHVVVSKGRLVLSQDGENHFVLQSSEDPKGAHLETPNSVVLSAGDATLTMNSDGTGTVRLESPTKIELVVGDSKVVITSDKVLANKKTMPV